MLSLIFIPALILILAVAVDIMATRMTGRRLNGYLASLIIAAFGTPTLMTLTGADIYAHIIALGFSLMGWFTYLNLAQAIESSLRIQILRDINNRGGTISHEDLQATYNDRNLINIRIQRLIDADIVKSDNGRLYLSSNKLMPIAGVFQTLRLIVLGRKDL